MPDFVFSLLAFIVAISVLVAVHEFGHFWVARKLGFKVQRFSIGFGTPLWRWHGAAPDRVEYCISAIPLGGYVKMLDEREGEVEPHERHRAFNRRPVAQRIVVLLAGPAFNFLLAIVVYWAMFMGGVPGIRPMVGAITPDSPAAAADLRTGDLIEAVGDRPIATLEDAVLAILDELLASGRIDLQVRGSEGALRHAVLDVRGRASELTEPDALFSGLGFEPSAELPADIESVDPGSPAERGGLRAGDRVVETDGEPVQSWQRWVEVVRSRPGESLAVGVLRAGAIVHLTLTPDAVEEDGQRFGRVGARVVRVEQRYGPLAAVWHAASKTMEMSVLTVKLVGNMVVGQVSIRNASGPIMIAAYAGDSASAGLTSFLGFLGIVSISLGVMNLLPVPILDGGRILFQVAEWLKGAPLSERAEAFGQQIGLVILIALMSVVFYNDLTRIFGT